jgi:prophage antirepressor-like protein
MKTNATTIALAKPELSLTHPATGAMFPSFIGPDGLACFYAKETCAALAHSNSRQALSALDDNQKGVTIRYTRGGPQTVAYVTESGLYALLLKSRLPAAKAWRDWLFDVVLPEIHRTGSYLPGATEIEKIRAGQRRITLERRALADKHALLLAESGWLSLRDYRLEQGVPARDALAVSRRLQYLAKRYAIAPQKLYLRGAPSNPVNVWPRFILAQAVESTIPRLPFAP